MRDIMDDVQRWLDAGERQIVLATVIRTFNSAPRGVGAKMAVSASGAIAGSVSGGCVEAAVIAESAGMSAGHAPRVFHAEAPDESAWAVGLPCGGSIDVLLEPLDRGSFDFLRTALQKNEPATSITIIRGPAELLGRKASWSRSVEPHGTIPAALSERLIRAAEGLAGTGTIILGEGTEALIEKFPPAVTLVIVGGAHIAIALTRLAKVMGYRTVVIDPRKTFGNSARFPDVDSLLQRWPEEAYATAGLTQETAVAVLTHDSKLDDPALAGALRSPAFYIGALGSPRSQEKRRERLRQLGFRESDLARIRGPIGLDIGAANPEEIALAILSEVVALSRGAKASLRPGNSLTNEGSQGKIDP